MRERPALPLPYPPVDGQHRTQALHGARPARKDAVFRCLKIWLLTLSAAAVLPVLAQAHAILEESTPPAGASVKAGPVTLRFRYNSRIDQGRSRLTLIRPDHTRDTVAIVPGGPPDILSSHLELTPGAYIVRWQVLAVDGHITRGDVPLTVTAP
jgi:methionine-rich copper-binding protein CopC